MRVQRAYKTELDLNDLQVTACRQHAGAARWAYNWGLQVKQERYRATTKRPTAIDLHRELNALKKTAVPWMYRVSKCAPQEALWNLDAAFQQFLRRCVLKKHRSGRTHIPSRHWIGRPSETVRWQQHKLYLPSLPDRWRCSLMLSAASSAWWLCRWAARQASLVKSTVGLNSPDPTRQRKCGASKASE